MSPNARRIPTQDKLKMGLEDPAHQKIKKRKIGTNKKQNVLIGYISGLELKQIGTENE